MQDKTWYSILGLDAEPLFLQDTMLMLWRVLRIFVHCKEYSISANSFRGNYSFLNLALWTKSAETIQGLKLQRVLALCDFWDLEKFALAKNRIRHVSIANVRIN